MIMQTAEPGRPHLAIAMHEHTALSGQFARAFGNAQFEAPSPLDLVIYIIANHDAGWAAFDRDPATDAATGLPFHVIGTPAQFITITSRLSPEFNTRHHAYCGLLSSMHSWGIYNGRYGLSKKVLVDRFGADERPIIDALLASEIERQAALKAVLAAAPETADWIAHDKLFQNYKLLQFCDTLALYFNCTHPDGRRADVFQHVPIDRTRDAAVSIEPRGDGVYALSPFPFATSGAEFAFAGCPVMPRQHEAAGGWAAVLRSTPSAWQQLTLVAG